MSPSRVSMASTVKSIFTEDAEAAFLLNSSSTLTASGSFWADRGRDKAKARARVRIREKSGCVSMKPLFFISDSLFIKPLQNLFQSLRVLNNDVARLASFEGSHYACRLQLVNDASGAIVTQLHAPLDE